LTTPFSFSDLSPGRGELELDLDTSVDMVTMPSSGLLRPSITSAVGNPSESEVRDDHLLRRGDTSFLELDLDLVIVIPITSDLDRADEFLRPVFVVEGRTEDGLGETDAFENSSIRVDPRQLA